MAIQAFIQQPTENSVHAAYRPVIVRVSATANNGGGDTPPVVYCDIYFNDIFYKTLSKTLRSSLGSGNSEWAFDIQDAAQEFLQKYIAPIGQSTIEEVTEIICKAFCRMRCSGINDDGFIEQDGTIPVQATSSSDATPGTGLETNAFYIVNGTLQHKDQQDLVTHLSYYKTGTWVPDVHPLSHRLDGYALAPADSDQFPILDQGDRSISNIRLNYRNCNQTEFGQASISAGATPTCNAIISPPTALHNLSGWLVSWNLVSGSPNRYFVSTPEVSGGAPQEAFISEYQLPELSEGVHVVTVRPLCLIGGEFFPGTAQTVNITVTACVDLTSIASGLPDAIEGVVYNHSLAVVGSTPLALSDIIKPAWMTITASGSNILFSGTPVGTGNENVIFTVSNCGVPTFNFAEVIEIVAAPAGDGTLTITNARPGSSIINVTPVIWTNQVGSYPLANGQSINGDLVTPFTGTVDVTVTLVSGTGTLRLLENGSAIQFVAVSGSGTFTIPSDTYSPGNAYLIVLTP